MKKSSSGSCPPKCTNEEETVPHILGQGFAMAQLRGKCFKKHNLSINDIMDNHHIASTVKGLFTYYVLTEGEGGGFQLITLM